MSDAWPFSDPPNVASFTTRAVMQGAPILYVFHDWDDGAWQFHADGPVISADCMIVALKGVLELDPGIGELHDLPYGWKAERTAKGAPWRWSKCHPYPSFVEDGYYLELGTDYVHWFPDTFKIPSEEIRAALKPGTLAKLIFRFASEGAARQNNQCERMWVIVKEVDEEHFCYHGVLDNDPSLHDALKSGDRVTFHANHVIAVDSM
jgi:hypothetical protein